MLSKASLQKMYLEKMMGTYQIARVAKVDPKTVYEHLKKHGIPIRKRTWGTTKGCRPYHVKKWLQSEYAKKSTGDIARDFGVTDANIIFYLRKFNIPRRSISESRVMKKWGARGSANGMYGRKGDKSPAWKGGISPERQSFYANPEWIEARGIVLKRDHKRCRRCGSTSQLHIHHRVSFAVKELRCEPRNLVTLCKKCHLWVHSQANKRRSWIKDA